MRLGITTIRPMSRAWLRRPITIAGVIVAALLLTVLIPVWVVLGAIADVLRGLWRFPTLRLLSFAWCWTWLETAGVLVSGLLWITGQGRNLRANYALQRWWAKRLIASLRVTCGLGIDVEGVDELPSGPLVCFGRHASLGDALVSAWIFGSEAHRFPRYVMKKELLLDPCLDIVGQRIPNWFVDRGSAAVRQEIAGIRTMAEGMGERDVAVIFPEGTRANDSKREYLVGRLEKRTPDRHLLMSDLKYLLPPRAAGAAALLEAVPDADVVLMWHVGFDGLDSFGGILRRLAAAEPSARVVLESCARSTVPTGDAFSEWLDRRWVEIDAKVVAADAERSV